MGKTKVSRAGLWSEETGVTQAGVDVLEYATRK